MEYASTYAKTMIETLLNVHALASMHRSSGDDHYRETAAGWLPSLENQWASLKRELERPSPAPEG